MAKRMTVSIFVMVALAIVALLMPFFGKYFFTVVSVTTLTPQTYQEVIYATGRIEEESTSEITYDIPIVPDEVYVKIGDSVQAGDILATIDTEKTKDAILKLVSLSNKLPKEAVAVISALSFDSEKLLKAMPTQVVAKANGVVTDMSLMSGAMTYPTEACAVISDLSKLQVRLNVSEKDADSLLLSQAVRMSAGAKEQEYFYGTVQEIFPTAHNTLVGTSQETIVQCYSSIEENGQGLKAGYTVSAEIAAGEPQTLLSLPYTAIEQDDSGMEYVYVYQDGYAVKRPVTTGIEMQNLAQITSGVEEQDLVITNVDKIKRDGQRVSLHHTTKEEQE